MTSDTNEKYVLKISNVSEDESALDMQHKCWSHLKSKGLKNVPEIIPDACGNSLVKVSTGRHGSLLCRLIKFVEQTPDPFMSSWSQVDQNSMFS